MRAVGPGHVQTAIGEIEPRLGHARQALHRAFDARDAGAAGDALDRQIHAERAVAGRLGKEREVERFAHGFVDPRYRNVTRLRERNTPLVAAIKIDDQFPLPRLRLRPRRERRRRRRGAAQ